MTLQEYIHLDRMDYFPPFSKGGWIDRLLRSEQYWIRKYVRYLRSEEYYTKYKKNKILRYYYFRKKNSLGSRLGFFICAGSFDAGLKICHYGSVIINPQARIGKNCTLHGNCCIGNKGTGDSPIIGDHVDVGQFAQILGDIVIADGVRIGAGAVVTKSILTPGVSVAGVPARVIVKNNVEENRDK